MEEYNSSSEINTQVITSAKKAIASIRNNVFRKKTSWTHQMREVKPQELTKKVIGILCGNDLTDKDAPKDKTSVNIQSSFHSCSTGAEENENIKAGTIQPPGVSRSTATCECCGNKCVEKICLVKIDSGQLLCPDCLKSLRDAAISVTIRQERGEPSKT